MNAEDAIGVYSTFLFADVVAQILEHADSADPLMLYLSWQNVHAPLDLTGATGVWTGGSVVSRPRDERGRYLPMIRVNK